MARTPDTRTPEAAPAPTPASGSAPTPGPGLAPDPDAFLADCRARQAFDLLLNTWNPVVLWALRQGPLRHGALRTRIGGISAKVLTETLRRLEHHGLVSRTTHPAAPPRVEYGLTDLGRTLLDPIDSFGRWAFTHGDALLRAQDEANSA
ncbi:winged helix-turn-helix transcriptional regulator [Streptomyces physcomitrii]|uniref:winged helix-turn-helix transcriptional regulator n=1 Tax=Streptomyces physcomitrii TaxID=2724184 RepID=UPI003F4CF3FF